MALKIIWSRRAAQGYDNILNYLIENWTEREVKNVSSGDLKVSGIIERESQNASKE